MVERRWTKRKGKDSFGYSALCRMNNVAPSTLAREALARGFIIKFDSGNRIPVSEAQEIRNFVESLREKGVIPQVGQRMKYS
jgi:hypothetical protein